MPDSSPSASSNVYQSEEFEALYRRHLDAVFRYAWKCVGRREIAEEIAADAFLALYHHADQVRSGELPAWLLTVVKNRAIDYWRRQAVERRYVSSTTPAVEAETTIDEGRLFDSQVLKPVHRACLILRYAHGMDRREIAEYTGLTPDRVKSYLQYARQLLRAQLLEQPGARR
jgi:RNA polymerase sigma-70 factor (ECF subfamily)